MAETGKRKSYVLFCFHTAGKRLVTHNCCWRQDHSCFSWWLPSWFLGLHHPHAGKFALAATFGKHSALVVKAQNRFVELSTPHGPMKGTPLYLAPDCFFNAAPPTPKAEVWGPGCHCARNLWRTRAASFCLKPYGLLLHSEASKPLVVCVEPSCLAW